MVSRIYKNSHDRKVQEDVKQCLGRCGSDAYLGFGLTVACGKVVKMNENSKEQPVPTIVE